LGDNKFGYTGAASIGKFLNLNLNLNKPIFLSGLTVGTE